MKLPLSISLLILVFGCHNEKCELNERDNYLYIGYLNGRFDTTYVDKPYFHQLLDTMIADKIFICRDIAHTIRKYTNDNHASTDGGSLKFELDSLGIIYSKSTTWNSYIRLHSSNDSLEALINTGIEIIILHENLSCYDFREVFGNEGINFTPPSME